MQVASLDIIIEDCYSFAASQFMGYHEGLGKKGLGKIMDLKRKACAAIKNKDYKRAYNLLKKIHYQEPLDMRSFIRLADMKVKIGNIKDALADYNTIANQYAENGFVIPALAINKIIKRLEPEYTGIDEKLRLLKLERGDDWAISGTRGTEDPTDAVENTNALKPKDRLKMGFMRTPLLSHLSDNDLHVFIESLQLKEYEANDLIYQDGDQGEFLYLIGMGKVRLQIKTTSGEDKTFEKLRETDFFGEYAFLSHLQHNHTAVAEVDCKILAVDRSRFRQLVIKHTKIRHVVEEFYRKRVLKRVLAITPLFNKLSDSLVMALSEKFSNRHFYKEEIVLQEGDLANTFYLIRSGSIRVYINKNHVDNDNFIGLGTRGEGTFFGEIALLKTKTRTATIIANEDLDLLALTRKDFTALCKRYPEIKKVVATYCEHRIKKSIISLVYHEKS